MDILQAIGIAGDLTINGKRDDIKVLRRMPDNNIKVSSIDITNSNFIDQNLFKFFLVMLLVINPNNSRVKNAGIIGNSGTLLSLLSFFYLQLL